MWIPHTLADRSPIIEFVFTVASLKKDLRNPLFKFIHLQPHSAFPFVEVITHDLVMKTMKKKVLMC